MTGTGGTVAGVTVRIRVVVAPYTADELSATLARMIEEHRATCGPEGLVPALLAEDLVQRLRDRRELYTLARTDDGLGPAELP